jgi:hypothetical protein
MKGAPRFESGRRLTKLLQMAQLRCPQRRRRGHSAYVSSRIRRVGCDQAAGQRAQENSRVKKIVAEQALEATRGTAGLPDDVKLALRDCSL